MKIEVKISKKPIKYRVAMNILEKRIKSVIENKKPELLWILEHDSIYTGGTSYKDSEILDKSIKVIKTNRGGKITWHGPGQIICYFVIDLNKRKKDVKKFITTIENTIIKTLNFYNVKSFNDPKNIGIWVKKKNYTQKVGAIGLRLKKWIAYHGFSINVYNKIDNYKKIVPCGISNMGVTSLYLYKEQNYKNIKKKIIKNFIDNLKF
tara:strand:+ start:28 stop:648 length:621 start_codon:yes stop_codon:yes gene_type:complete